MNRIFSSNIEVRPELVEGMKKLADASNEITLIGLATSDGFKIRTLASKSLNIEPDKLAAMASSMCALSDSSAAQLTKGKFRMTTIETEEGNVLFMNTSYLGKPCVATLAAKEALSLANARFIIQRFVAEVESL